GNDRRRSFGKVHELDQVVRIVGFAFWKDMKRRAGCELIGIHRRAFVGTLRVNQLIPGLDCFSSPAKCFERKCRNHEGNRKDGERDPDQPQQRPASRGWQVERSRKRWGFRSLLRRGRLITHNASFSLVWNIRASDASARAVSTVFTRGYHRRVRRNRLPRRQTLPCKTPEGSRLRWNRTRQGAREPGWTSRSRHPRPGFRRRS